jgi:hypothetical protein
VFEGVINEAKSAVSGLVLRYAARAFWTNSAASCGNRSARPSADRYSMM